MKRLLIVGAGITGLTLAYRLQQRRPGLEITLLEADSRPGGKVWTDRLAGFQVETGPNGFLDSKPSTIGLCRDLGLAGELVQASTASARNRYLFAGGKLRALPASPTAFLASDLLSWPGKLRLLLEPLRGPRRSQHDESVADFTRRRAGREAVLLADAMATGIHGGDPELLSLPAAFPRLARLERESGSVVRGLMRAARQRRREAVSRGEPPARGGMWSFRRGLRVLVEALCARLDRPPILGAAVRGLEKTDSGWRLRGDGRNSWEADAVVLACPPGQQSELAGQVDEELGRLISGIPSNRIAVAALGYRADEVPVSLSGFGYIAPQREGRDLLGVQWCSSIFPDRAPEGLVLLRALCGGWRRSEVVSWAEDRLISAVRSELRLAMGITAAPRFHHVVRWHQAIPQYHLGHLERVASIQERAARHAGLHLAGNAYHGVALNDCVEQAERLAVQLA